MSVLGGAPKQAPSGEHSCNAQYLHERTAGKTGHALHTSASRRSDFPGGYRRQHFRQQKRMLPLFQIYDSDDAFRISDEISYF